MALCARASGTWELQPDWILLRGLNDNLGPPGGNHGARIGFQRPTHLFADDVSWMRGKHTWQFGGAGRVLSGQPSNQLCILVQLCPAPTRPGQLHPDMRRRALRH